jgi:hypothetical protein
MNPKEECELLLQTVLTFAKQMLSENGEFFPFGAKMNLEGTITHVGASTGEERPSSKELIDLMIEAFQYEAREQKLRACAVVYDNLIKPPGYEVKKDAIAIAMDHMNNFSVVMMVPYELRKDTVPIYYQPFAFPGDGLIFSSAKER